VIIASCPSTAGSGLTSIDSDDGHVEVVQHVEVAIGVQQGAVVATGQHGTTSGRADVIGPQQSGWLAASGQMTNARLRAELAAEAAGVATATGAASMARPRAAPVSHRDMCFTLACIPEWRAPTPRAVALGRRHEMLPG
jgi:hypothetical protein